MILLPLGVIKSFQRTDIWEDITLKVLILGGTGVLSRAIVERLLEKNYEVTFFNRGNKQLSFKREVEQIVGDRTNHEEFEASMKKLNFDAVIDMLSFN